MTAKRYHKLQMAWVAELHKQAKEGGYDNRKAHLVAHKWLAPNWEKVGSYQEAWDTLQSALYFPVGEKQR